MALISSMSIALDRNTSYSRYDLTTPANVITVTITISPTSAVTDTLTVTLQRQSTARGADVINTASNAPIIPIVSAPYVVQTNIINLSNFSGTTVTTTFDVRAAQDANGFINARHSMVEGDYNIIATTTTQGVTAQANTTVTIMTVEEMKQRWCYGAPLIAFEQLMPKLQPQLVTGVTIKTVGFGTARGLYPLVYTPGSPATLQWGNSTPITLNPAITQYVLYDQAGNNVTISVNFASLPVSTTTENIFLDYNTISDQWILQQIIQTTADVERGLMTYLEPTHVVARNFLQFTNNPPTIYDIISEGVPFYKYNEEMRWLTIETPFVNILKINTIAGFFNQQQTVVIPLDWITYDTRNGLVQLVPTNFAVLDWLFLGAAFYAFFIQNNYVPNFWSFDVICGLREGVFEDIRAYIAMCAACIVLAQVGMARYPAGVTSYSVGRDGVSESASLIPGVYRQLIDQYENAIGRMPGQMYDRMLIKLRTKYAGLFLRTL